jgi:hypothetical protein
VPKRVSVPDACHVEESDIASQLELLSFLSRSEAPDADAAAGKESSPAPGEPAPEGMTA